ncbi:MAG: ABC transporter ATP-binding protein [Arcobacter sp.]|nr:ABC transporter ATP-binding protein [Arcobacter sp.]|tara:strand:+ start:10355 stop:12028 length:1674 start_codon:yes stop_codon:yes gene_type:complete
MIKKINFLLTRNDKKWLGLLLLLSLIASIIETVGISAIMPFISMASNPELILDNKYLKFLFDLFDFKDKQKFIIYFGSILIFFYIFRALYTILFGYLLNKFALNKYSSFANQLFKNYIDMPYIDFVNKNSSNLTKSIITEAAQLSFVIKNILMLFSEILVVIILYILLILVDVKMTIVLTLFLGIKIIILKMTITKKIKQEGKKREKIQNKYYRKISESFGNFKFIKFISNKNNLLNDFYEISKNFSKIQITNTTLQLIPRTMLEATGLSIIIGVVIYIIAVNSDSSTVIPIIAMYALALYRILPAVTRILDNYNNIVFHSPSLDVVYNELIYYYEKEYENSIAFNKRIEIKNLSFSYNNNNKLLEDMTLNIEIGEKIAFIGKSGCGKSTLVDLICGIYKPSDGNILIDGVILDNSNIVAWRKKIGYIPQSIYLFDGTISDNITFGRKYDKERIEYVLKQTKIYDLIMEKEGFNTMVGEGGIQLSGGQKQRIGIARALYGNPEILVLDEATSALDSMTESAIMDEIYKISEDKTLLIIAHRLSTIEKCDRKIDLSKK